MFLKKSFYSIFSIFLIFYFFVNFPYFLSISKNFFNFSGSFYFPLDFCFNIDYEVKYFLFMVTLVSSLVVLYGEFYMEHYNNKKFALLVLIFLVSMVVLSISGSPMVLMIGWDSLGISSLFLIMFYPGKIPMFNSLMTFFYNRLGDCFLMLIICLMLNNSSLSLYFYHSSDLILISSLLIICSFTKSAQFPLSSWLPAAMSAPTPISAMVHSSTLVTAGIYLILKFIFVFDTLGFLSILLLHSCLTFLVGGLLGVLNLDLKKIVAFSTMSQISMIILFSCLIFVNLSYSHMIFHALFKTLLFCSCGVTFFFIFSDQLSKIFLMGSTNIYFIFLFFVSVFCMSGLPFSSSFFSKDLFIENCVTLKMSFLMVLFMFGSILTILYSSKIFSMVSNSYFSFSPSNFKKKSFIFFMFLFSLMTFTSPYLVEFFLLPSFIPTVSNEDLLLILGLMILSLSIKMFFKNKSIYNSSGIFFSEFMTFTTLGKFSFLDLYSFNFNDHLIFKPNVFMSFKKKFAMNFLSLTLFLMFLLILFSFF